MVLHTPKTIKRTPFAVIGDKVNKVRHDIFLKLEEDGVRVYGFVDMQLLKILLDYINDSEIRSMGGVPQMVKIYSFMNILPFGFLNEDRHLFHFGRSLMGYETYPYPIIDLQNGKQVYMKEIKRVRTSSRPT